MHILIISISYFLGSLPTGFLFGKFLKNIDLRLIGSGSTGATNVLHGQPRVWSVRRVGLVGERWDLEGDPRG